MCAIKKKWPTFTDFSRFGVPVSFACFARTIDDLLRTTTSAPQECTCRGRCRLAGIKRSASWITPSPTHTHTNTELCSYVFGARRVGSSAGLFCIHFQFPFARFRSFSVAITGRSLHRKYPSSLLHLPSSCRLLFCRLAVLP